MCDFYHFQTQFFVLALILMLSVMIANLWLSIIKINFLRSFDLFWCLVYNIGSCELSLKLLIQFALTCEIAINAINLYFSNFPWFLNDPCWMLILDRFCQIFWDSADESWRILGDSWFMLIIIDISWWFLDIWNCINLACECHQSTMWISSRCKQLIPTE